MADGPVNDAPYRLIADVEFGENVVVHSFTNLYGCTIGDNTRVGTFVEIQRGAKIGANCKIQSHTFICDGVTIEDEVFVGHGVMFVNDKRPAAVNERGELAADEDWTLAATSVRRGAAIGSGAVILGGIEIGSGAMVGAGATVTRDVAAGTTVVGERARPRPKPRRPGLAEKARRGASIGPDVCKNLALAVPGARRLNGRRRLRRGYDPGTNAMSYPRSIYDLHREAIARERPVSGTLLEIGPGGNLAVAALFAANGVESAVCLDADPWLGDPGDLYDLLGVRDAVDRVQYVTGSIESPPFPDASFDIIVSHAAFEHFSDPDAATKSIARLLKPGGVTTHQIDLRDHRDFSQPLDFLRYGPRLWRLATSNRMLMTNRWRASDIRASFEEAGLEIYEFRATERAVVTDAEVARFAPPNDSKSVADLAVVGLFVAAAKR